MAIEAHQSLLSPAEAAPLPSLPTGTVTLILADLEDSSRAWERDERGMAATIERLNVCIDLEVARHNGMRPVEQGEGDSFVAAFSRASEAIACALAIQLATGASNWPPGCEPRLRMALHTGEIELRDAGNYMGPTINRCGRLRSLAVGGQILVSRTTADLLLDALPPRTTLLDLGPHILRGFEREEVIFQLCHPDLPRDFPLLPLEDAAPRVFPAATPPVPLTRTIGREHEIRAVASLLRKGVRLITLTGPGGVGKTRLSIEVARSLEGHFRHGVHFFPLASIEDPTQVLPALARRCGIAIEGRANVLDAIIEHLRTRQLLLVLDNFEHLVAAAPQLSAILDRCASVQALVTSRHVLRVREEQAYDVLPLATPPASESDATVAAVARSPAVQLLLERAGQASAPLMVTDANAAAIAELCRRLDGLPLAIELAASRMRLLPPAALLSRLDQRLDVLTAGSVDAADRHRTLRAAIDWSHDLMTDPERAVFARLSVFAGGCTLEAANQVCRKSDDEPDVLDSVSALLEQSLLVASSDAAAEPRVRMLESVRAYAWERLTERGEADEIQRRHMEWVRDLMDQAMPQLCGPGQRTWTARLDHERENIRAAVQHAIGTADAQSVAHIVLASFPYLSMRSGLSELCEWVEQGMDLMATAPPDVRATHRLAGALCALAQGEMERARELAPAFGEIEVPGSLEEGLLLWVNGVLADAEGDRERAEGALTRARAMFAGVANDWAVGYTESTLGDIHLRAGEHPYAAAHHERALGIAKRITNLPLAGRSLTRLALVSLASGDTSAAIRHIEDAAAVYRTIGHRAGLVFCVDAGAIAAARTGNPGLAARAFGAVGATRERLDTGLWAMVRPMFEEAEMQVRRQLGEAAYVAAVAEGASGDVDGCLDELLATFAEVGTSDVSGQG
jgi:predicted ATPase/class 3 adenylate cyclase